MKYDFDLALDQNTSTGKIIAHIKDGSRVLEFGPGNGRVTRYLTKVKRCSVSIVEFDKELYNEVMKFADDGFLGNIEDFEWCEYFSDQVFDVIIFADVLEHLQDPLKVLEYSKKCLKSDGVFLVSFPNIGHNSVLIDLFNNNFSYNEYGLLDKTHNTFYTQDGFEKLFEKTGLYINEEDYTYAQVGQTEFDNSYADLPIEMQYDFKIRPFGEVYQYFFVLSLKANVSFKRKIPENSNAVVQLNLVYDYGNDIKVEPWLLNILTGENQRIILDIPDTLNALKILPMQAKGALKFKACSEDDMIKSIKTNAIWNSKDSYVFLNGNPFLRIEGESIRGRRLELYFEFYHIGEYSEIQKKILIDYYMKKNENINLCKKLDIKSGRNGDKVETMKNRYIQIIDSNLWKTLDGIRNISNLYRRKKQLILKKNSFFKYNIDAVDFDHERNSVFIRGWGFSNSDNKKLDYVVPAEEGAYFKVTRQDRFDVCDVFSIDRNCKLGFMIEIEGAILKRYYHLILKTNTGIKILIRIDRLNLEEKYFMQKVKKDIKTVQQFGIAEAYKKFIFHKSHRSSDDYDYWIYKNEKVDLEKIRQDINSFEITPKISVVVPVYNVEEKWLQKCIDSLRKQVYKNWELCIADDCSTKTYVRPLLEKMSQKDKRIKLVFRNENGHISQATNSAIEISTGEFIGFMDNDDELSPMALYEIVKTINEQSDIDFIYTDEDKINVKGKRFDPFFKPNWNSVLLCGHNYITHFVVVKRTLLDKVGALRSTMDGSQDYDFVLRATEQAKHIWHIPKILYHWRTIETSVAFDPKSKEYAYTAGKKALEESLARKNLHGNVKMTRNYGAYKINYNYEIKPMLSIILWGANKDIEKIVNAILNNADYSNFEILVPAEQKELLKYEDARIRFLQSYNFNKRAEEAKGQYLLFLKNSILVEKKRNISELLNYGLKDGVGIVGGKIVTKENIVYNAGVWIDDKKQQIHYVHRGCSDRSLGYYFRIVLPQNVFAVTEDCLLISKENYLKAGGINESLADGLKGIDLCLKIRSMNLDIVWTPYFKGVEDCVENKLLTKQEYCEFNEVWPPEKRRDPYINPWILNDEV
ncbi:glycosyltransferase [Eubacterium sp. AM05-23]|nr:glycosyltransferase [Eubacterium sp. AM05-23]